ncbi:MAG: AraC family transcriptional regulator [Myxococcales bacterium]
MATLAPTALIDRRVSERVRFRSWRYAGERVWVADQASHAAIELSWVESSITRIAVGQRTLEPRCGSGLLIPAGVEHRTTFLPGARCATLHLDPRLVEEVAEAMGVGAPVLGTLQSARLPLLVGLLRVELEEAGAGHALAAEALVEAALVEALRPGTACPSAGSAPDPRIRRALELIQSRYAEPLAIEDLAAAAGMSRFHFSRRFLRVVGQSPYRYLTETRLKRAAELLARGRGSVTEAALAAGFGDLGRFGRLFRRRFGCTPSQYLGRLPRAR